MKRITLVLEKETFKEAKRAFFKKITVTFPATKYWETRLGAENEPATAILRSGIGKNVERLRAEIKRVICYGNTYVVQLRKIKKIKEKYYE